MAKYIYPHVNITTKALKRRVPTPVESTATTLLAPFTCDRGPENELVAVDTLSDFENIFGSLNYTKQGQRQILNIGKWLSSGGRVLACRLTDIDETDTVIPTAKKAHSDLDTQTVVLLRSLQPEYDSKLRESLYTYNARQIIESEIPPLTKPRNTDLYTFKWSAKYSGSYYNKIQVFINQIKTNKNLFNITVENDGVVVEKYSNLPISKFYKISNNSDYINEINFVKLGNLTDKDLHAVISGTVSAISGNAAELLREPFTLNDSNGNIKVNGITNLSDFDEDDLSAMISSDELVIEGLLIKDKETNQLINPKLRFYKHSGGVVVPKEADPIEDFESAKLILNTHNTKWANNFCDNEIQKIKLHDTVIIPNDNDIFVNITPNYVWKFKTSKNTLGADVSDISWLVEADSKNNISHLTNKLVKILKQPLETPFDTFIDCGYSLKIKKELLELFTGVKTFTEGDDNHIVDNVNFEPRLDVFLVLSQYILSGTATTISECNESKLTPTERKSEFINTAVYDNYHKIIDLYSEYNGREVYVPSTYFISGLLPYNDITYGTQYPSAGLTRGVVKGSLWIDSIPSNKQKQENYENGLNYIEKDSRGEYFMTQLTYTSDDTALKFVNNSRSLLKMKKELTKLARNYLHEFNDRITKANLLNALNGALSNWIQNRTLSYGSVNLLDYTDNESLTNEELLIQLDIKFTGTIEIISVEFTVE